MAENFKGSGKGYTIASLQFFGSSLFHVGKLNSSFPVSIPINQQIS
jgi:hypothetical protein